MPPRRVSKRNAGATADAAENDAPAEKNAATTRTTTKANSKAKASTKKTAAANPKPDSKKAPARAAAAPKKPAKVPKEEPEEPEEPPRKKPRAASKPKAAMAPPAAKAAATKPNAVSNRMAPRRPARRFPILTTRPTERLHIFAFGTGENSELGLGPKATEVKRPRLNALLDIDKVGIVAIAYGGMHGLALSHDGKVYSWGVNDLGALGRITRADGEKMKSIDPDDSSSEEEDALLNEDESTPKPIEFPEGTNITRIAAADSASFFVTDTGFVYGCGTFRTSSGVLGFGSETRIQPVPALLNDLKGIVEICCGTEHAMALSNEGRAWAWGNGQQYQLGHRVIERTRINGLAPREIRIPRKKLKSIHTGSFHSFAITTDEKIYAWGFNSHAQCGVFQGAPVNNILVSLNSPTLIESLQDKGIVDIQGGDKHSVALTRDGRVFAFGRIDGSQVGIDPSKIPPEDVFVDEFGPRALLTPTLAMDSKATVIACGSNHNLAITEEDGSVYSWGFGDQYQCGLGNCDDVKVPTKIVNTAVRNIKMTVACCGGQVSIIGGIEKPQVNGVVPDGDKSA